MLFLVLLNVPLPLQLRKLVLAVVDGTLFMRIGLLGDMMLINILVAISGIAFLFLCVETHELAAKVSQEGLDHKQQLMIRTQKFRAERNFWMGLLALSLWMLLYLFRSLVKENLDLKTRLKANETKRD